MLLFLVIPVVELYVIVQVAQGIGVLETLALLIVISALGAWLVKREGFGVLARIQQRVHAGQVPTTELVDGGLIMFAGALMLTPGFVTDCVALLLLFPPTRIVVRAAALRWFQSRKRRGRTTGWRVSGFGTGPPGGPPPWGRAPGGRPPGSDRGRGRSGPIIDVPEGRGQVPDDDDPTGGRSTFGR